MRTHGGHYCLAYNCPAFAKATVGLRGGFDVRHADPSRKRLHHWTINSALGNEKSRRRALQNALRHSQRSRGRQRDSEARTLQRTFIFALRYQAPNQPQRHLHHTADSSRSVYRLLLESDTRAPQLPHGSKDPLDP